MLFKARKKLKTAHDFKSDCINSDIWARWKSNWERPENKALSARNSSNRRGGRDKAEATHIGCLVPHAKTMRDLEKSMGQKHTPYESFTKTYGVFDAESVTCSQWSNIMSQKVHVEYRALLEEHPTCDQNQMWFDAVNNVDVGKK